MNHLPQIDLHPRSIISRPVVLTACALLVFSSHAPATEFMAGADISALSELEDFGAEYSDGGVVGDAVDIFRDHGINWFRLRMFVNPNGSGVVVNDLAYTIELAQRVKASGAKLLIDFHYSDTWADPGHQAKPSAWTSLNFSQLQTRVHDYTRDMIIGLKNANALPDMVQIGNEIANGMLYADGQLWRAGVTEDQEFTNLAALISAGITGAYDGANDASGPGPGPEPLVMIHHDKGANWGTTSYYFDRLLPKLQTNGTDIDVIGYSYYPKWHYDPTTGSGDMGDVQFNLNNTANAYGKPVAIVETGFPSWGAQWEPDYEFDVSEAGQELFLQTLVDTVQAVPNDRGLGVFWWYPEAVELQVNGQWVWEGGRYGLFDPNNDAVPALGVFDQFIPAPTLPGDFNGDNKVDNADYTVWRDNLGAGDESSLNGNGDEMNGVDEGDFDLWRMHWGEMGMGSGSLGGGGAGAAGPLAAVPEPSTLLLLIAGVGLAWGRLRTL